MWREKVIYMLSYNEYKRRQRWPSKQVLCQFLVTVIVPMPSITIIRTLVRATKCAHTVIHISITRLRHYTIGPSSVTPLHNAKYNWIKVHVILIVKCSRKPVTKNELRKMTKGKYRRIPM